MSRFVFAAVASFAVLMLLNMFVFPLIFPGSVASKFVDSRPTPIIGLHLAAFAATAVLLTALCAIAISTPSILKAVGIGALAGLLAALPTTLHTSAMAQVFISSEIKAVLWTTFSWATTAGVAHAVLWWQRTT